MEKATSYIIAYGEVFWSIKSYQLNSNSAAAENINDFLQLNLFVIHLYFMADNGNWKLYKTEKK